MSTTIEQIRKVNVYEEDENGKRTLVQKDVPLGSNVVMENETPSEELYLLTGKEDTIANTITLYPTKVKVSSDGEINAKDFLIDNNNIKGKFVSNIYWGEDSSTTPPVRRLYYKINDNSFQVKNSGGTNALNLLQVPYLELYSTNTIKTRDSTNPLYLNVDNVTSTHLAKNTKVVLGHTAIKDSSLDLVDNSRGYLGARLGVDTREGYLYGYLDFFTPIKEKDGTLKTHEIGNIYADPDKGFCILPKNILHKDINTSETDELLPVIAGYIGVSDHKFEHMWAKNLHGNIQPVLYNGAAPDSKVSLADLGFEDQLIYIGGDFGKSDKLTDMPFDSVNGYCITLKTYDDKNKSVIKQIFIRGGTKGSITERRVYIRTGYKGTDSTWNYGNWTPALGHTDWTEISEFQNIGFGITKVKDKEYYTMPIGAISMATKVIQARQFLDIYQSYDYKNDFLIHRSINQIKATIDKAITNFEEDQKKNPKLNPNKNLVACGYIKTKCYVTKKKGSTSERKRQYVNFIFTYNKNNEICLVGIDDSSNLISNKVELLRVKQYD